MPTGVFSVTDIPADKVAGVIADYNVHKPPPQIEKKEQDNKLWTVTATFPGPGTQVTKHKP